MVDEKTVMGVDFSGAQKKNSTQMTLAVLRDNVLELKPHEPLPTRLPQAHKELRKRILFLPRDAVVALDFPFAVPQDFAKEIARKEGKDPRVAQALDASEGTVYRIKRRFAEGGLEGVLQDRPQAHRYRKLDDRGEAHLIALACRPAPAGHDHWTLRLLAGKVVELGLASSMSHEGVRHRLKKTLSSRGRSRNGASPR